MKILPILLCTASAWGVPLQAQAMNMPGMTMPAPAKKKPAHKAPKPSTKPASHHAAPATERQSPAAPMPMPARPQPGQAEHGAMVMPMPPQGAAPAAAGAPAMPGMPMGPSAHGEQAMQMTGALGPHSMERESSGTAWQPDSSSHTGLMTQSGDWMLMAHGVLNLVYDHQSGSRGGDKTFASGMLMGMARRPLGNGTLQFKAMVSPDPIMGPSGYPLLLASGETANGRDRLIDRQHPHDFVMELSGSLSQNLGRKSSVFVYAGLPGEPAFGPPAFMHRESILDSPEAPISHHWLDSTHISFGVVTAGAVFDGVKLEVSRFNGHEPDQHRWDIETGPLDSTSVRLSWNPTRTLALQGSWGHFTDPEQLEPGVDQNRWSASAMWADEIARGWNAAATLAWGRKSALGHNDDALAAEASLKHAQWTLFGRAEMTENRELIRGQDEPAHRVGKVSLGVIRDFRIADHLSIGPGALLAVNFVPAALEPSYSGSNPFGMMGFVRLRLN